MLAEGWLRRERRKGKNEVVSEHALRIIREFIERLTDRTVGDQRGDSDRR